MVIDDDQEMLAAISDYVRGFHANLLCIATTSAEIGNTLLCTYSFDLVICEIAMPVIRGSTIIKNAKEKSCVTKTIAMTRHSIETGFEAGQCQPSAFYDKNTKYDLLFEHINKCLNDSCGFFRRFFPDGIVYASLGNFREKERIGRKLGFSLGRYSLTQKKLRALASEKQLSMLKKKEVAKIVGFSSPKRMHDSITDLKKLFQESTSDN